MRPRGWTAASSDLIKLESRCCRERYFVDVLNSDNQLTVSEEECPR